MASGEYRLRVRYGKVGRLRWLSHLEVVRALERATRRAGLKYAVTQGFSPHIKIAFGPALPVGTAGENEYYDVWLTRYTGIDEVFKRLVDATAEDLAPTAVGYVPEREVSLAAGITVAVYHVEVEGRDSEVGKVQSALAGIVELGTLTVQHRDKQKVFDLTRSLPEEMRVKEAEGGCTVELTVRMGPEGSLRPELLVRAALSSASLDASVRSTTRVETYFESEGELHTRPL
ncbi:MAG: DUF2344 domain-containing protein [Coriobacteriia bacterium]|nr:DUF2344 domain-containing protein [Coriobacteriia bacterium]